MPRYSIPEARAWARETLLGVANVTIPTMTSDFRGLNEAAIRHDVELSIAHGFVGSLSCSEVAITLQEYGDLVRIMVEQSKGRMFVVHQAVFNDLKDNIEAARLASEAGAELVLLGYPPCFYPKSYDDIFDYTKAFCDATDLAVMLFPIPTWGFGRLHPSDIPIPVLRRMVDSCPNVVAIKAEGGMPHLMAPIEVHREFHEEVVISFPMEQEFIPLAQLVDVPFCGTNFSAYFGPTLPHIFNLLRDGKLAEATNEYYRIDPARKAFWSVPGVSSGLINRMIWKYQNWLQGYNGGPLRHPTPRVYTRDMNVLRRGLEQSGFDVTTDPDEMFFVGRNPA